MPTALADILHCQHVVGNATERVGRDFRDVGMIDNFPAEENTEHRCNEGMNEVADRCHFYAGEKRRNRSGIDGQATQRCEDLHDTKRAPTRAQTLVMHIRLWGEMMLIEAQNQKGP